MLPKQVLINCFLGIGLATTTRALLTFPEAQAICAKEYSANGAPKIPYFSFEGCSDDPNGAPNPAIGACTVSPTTSSTFSPIASSTFSSVASSTLSFTGSSTSSQLASSTASLSASPSPVPFCPGANNSVYTSGGKNFAVLCGINTYGTQMPQQPGVDIKDCADKCAQTTGCVSTSYYQGTCYRKTAKTSEGPYTGVDSVNLLT